VTTWSAIVVAVIAAILPDPVGTLRAMARTRAGRRWRVALGAVAIAAVAVPTTATAEDPPATSPGAPPAPPAATNPAPTAAPAPAETHPQPVVPRPVPTTTRPATRTTTGPTTRTTVRRTEQTPTARRPASEQVLPAPNPPSREPQTSCRSVVQIGDSLSVGLDSPSLGRDARISARYAAVGVRSLRYDASGGRSVVETVNDQDGGETVARKVRKAGFDGCWVIALGTNDAADVDAGSPYGYTERIDRMMAIIGDDPVLWVDVKTLRDSGYYAAPHMRLFDQALAKAHARYPDLQVYDWSADVLDDWFLPDGIHYDAAGSTQRAAHLAAALAEAFPA
jgi:hypothetical protein